MARLSKKARRFIANKIAKVMDEGVRGRKVKVSQAVAIAFSAARKKGYKVPRKR